MRVATIFFVSLSGLVLLGLTGEDWSVFAVVLLVMHVHECAHFLLLSTAVKLVIPILLSNLIISSSLHFAVYMYLYPLSSATSSPKFVFKFVLVHNDSFNFSVCVCAK